MRCIIFPLLLCLNSCAELPQMFILAEEIVREEIKIHTHQEKTNGQEDQIHTKSDEKS